MVRKNYRIVKTVNVCTMAFLPDCGLLQSKVGRSVAKISQRSDRNKITLKTIENSVMVSEKLYRITLRWLDTVFQGQYLPSFSINYVAINKVFEKLPLQLN